MRTYEITATEVAGQPAKQWEARPVMATTASGWFEYVGMFESAVGWVRLWRCVQCGCVRVTLGEEPEPDECVCCERWDRRWQ